MRFHVVGVGAIGTLFAFHLRRNLPRTHDVRLIFRANTARHVPRDPRIRVEYQGSVTSETGFKVETLDEYKEMLYSLVFNNAGKLRLPARDHELLARAGVATPLEAGSEASRKPDSQEIESLFVACKAYSAFPVLKRLAHRLSPHSTVVLLTNGGLSVYEQLISGLFKNPEERPHFVLTSNTHGARLKAAQHIVHGGVGRLQFGIVPDGRQDMEKSLHDTSLPPEKRTLELNDIYSPDDPESPPTYRSLRNTIAVLKGLSPLQPSWESMADLQVQLQKKVVVNSVINPLTAILQCRNGDLYGDVAAKKLAGRICWEAQEVFAAEAYANAQLREEGNPGLHPALKQAALMDEWQRVARATAPNFSSMLQDIQRGKKVTEIDFLNGYLVRLGGRHNIPLPVNSTLCDLVRLRTSIPIDSIL